MSFTYSDRLREAFHQNGFTVFKKILPTSLIRDLRRVCLKAKELAREQSGPNSQRLQPVGKFEIDQQPFIDYADLPELVDAVQRVLTKRHRHGNRERLGILFEPAQSPWCTNWHRDWRDHMPPEVFDSEFRQDWQEQMFDYDHCNQINCALYEDSCTWFVPGSTYRMECLPGEWEAREAVPVSDLRTQGDRTPEEQERLCLNYCEGMPGAVRLNLDPGDFCLYRPVAWHLGNYAPHRIRATLHDTPMTPEVLQYIQERGPRKKRAIERSEKEASRIK